METLRNVAKNVADSAVEDAINDASKKTTEAVVDAQNDALSVVSENLHATPAEEGNEPAVPAEDVSVPTEDVSVPTEEVSAPTDEDTKPVQKSSLQCPQGFKIQWQTISNDGYEEIHCVPADSEVTGGKKNKRKALTKKRVRRFSQKKGGRKQLKSRKNT
jgi:uncharacterized protein YjaG (DUF416 family)